MGRGPWGGCARGGCARRAWCTHGQRDIHNLPLVRVAAGSECPPRRPLCLDQSGGAGVLAPQLHIKLLMRRVRNQGGLGRHGLAAKAQGLLHMQVLCVRHIVRSAVLRAGLLYLIQYCVPYDVA